MDQEGWGIKVLPQVNGKSLLSCTESDLCVLIDNNDYRENEYIDYKLTFSFLEMTKGRERDLKKTEFKCDVCSFANADGGFIVFGVRDKNGCAAAIEGIDIPDNDTDRFELDRRNDLSGIQPRVPSIEFAFVPLASEKYVVILAVKHDSFCPYIYLEDEKNFKIYKRYGNGKKPMAYNEIRQMFSQSFSMEQAIYNYRKERISHYRDLKESFGESFFHLSIIPDTFSDYTYNQNMFMLERSGKIQLSSLFSSFNCFSKSIPCVDGLRFLPYPGDQIRAECYLKNNGIIEACLFLDGVLKDSPKDNTIFLPWVWLWDKVSDTCRQYLQVFRPRIFGDRLFICLTLVGCKDVQTDNKDIWHDYTGIIDRDEVLCDPVEILIAENENEDELMMKKMYLSFILALGIRHGKELENLIHELYELQ